MKKILFYCVCLLMISCGKTQESKHEHHDHENHQHETHTETSDCGNCGMPTAEFPKWKSSIEQNDKKTFYCAPRCLFMTYFKDSEKLKNASISVNDYYELEQIDAQTAFYVIKSDVTGPMGHDLIPFKDKVSAEEFLTDHKGEKIIAFEEVTMEIIKELLNQ